MKAGQALGGASGAVFEAPGLVACFDDLAVMGEAVQERGGHLGIAKHCRPFSEGEVGGDDDRGALVELADQMEQQLAAGLGEGQIWPLNKPGAPVAVSVAPNNAGPASLPFDLQPDLCQYLG